VIETTFRFHVASAEGQLGLKAPTTKFDKASYSITGNEAHAALAERAALEGSVLLKNDMNVLPIAATVKKVAVVGPQVAVDVAGRAGERHREFRLRCSPGRPGLEPRQRGSGQEHFALCGLQSAGARRGWKSLAGTALPA
jgi:beta-glucosidase-like glycosyl hydrolase